MSVVPAVGNDHDHCPSTSPPAPIPSTNEVDAATTTGRSTMNGTKGRESLSSDCIIKCMFDAYANEGDALAVRMSPNLGYSDWGVFNNLNAIRKGDYEFVVVPWLHYGLLLRDDVAVGSPRSGGPIDDKCALDALAANDKKPQDLENKILRLRESESAEPLERLLNKMSLSAEKRRSKYLELKVAMLERKLDLADALRESDQLHECYNNEDASNGQSKRLLEIASERKDAYEEIEKANMAIFEAEEKMEAAEQNLMQ
ncbi:hypothetical protein ACKAV7_011662 [Fusarium commune]